MIVFNSQDFETHNLKIKKLSGLNKVREAINHGRSLGVETELALISGDGNDDPLDCYDTIVRHSAKAAVLPGLFHSSQQSAGCRGFLSISDWLSSYRAEFFMTA